MRRSEPPGRARSAGRPFRLAALALLGAGLPVAALGAERADPALSRRSSQELLALAARMAAADSVQAADSLSGGVVLYEQVLLDADGGRHHLVHNRVVRVMDGRRPDAVRIELPAPEGYSIERAEGWIVRGLDAIERLGRRGAHPLAPGGGRPGRVEFQYGDVRPGDVLGASLVLSAAFPLRFSELVLSGPLRVAVAEVELHNDPGSAYRMVGANVRESEFSAEVLRRHDWNATHSVLRFRNLPPMAQAPWLCPVAAREPLARIGRYGTYHPRFRDWYRSSSWGMVALELDALLAHSLLRQGDVRGRARDTTRGIQDDGARAAALCRYVRDAFVDVSLGATGGRLRDVESLLRAREANPWEKGVLLWALLQAARIPAEVYFVRDASLGPVQETEPSPWQFSDVIVRTAAAPTAWFAPAHATVAPGQLPASLRGARAFSLPADLSQQHERLVLDIFGMRGEADAFLQQLYRQDEQSFLRHQPITEQFPSYLVGQYLYLLKTQRWFTFSTLPAEAVGPSGRLSEEVVLDPDRGELQLRLTARGPAPPAPTVPIPGGPQERLAAYVAGRFPGMLRLSMEATAAEGDSLAGTGRIGAQAVPPPQGETWILPPPVVFGEPFLEDWVRADPPCFHAPEAVDLVRATRVPLPQGWSGVVPIPSYQFEWGPLRFRAEVTSDGRAVTFLRRLQVEACSLDGAELRALKEVARRIADYERVPQALVQASGGGR